MVDVIKIDPKEASGVILAYLGDAVWELYVRSYYINKGYNLQKLNQLVKSKVNAKEQSKFLNKIKEELTQEYLGIINRAKNGNIKTFPKSCSVMEYKEATAFEALIATLYIRGEREKISEIVERCLEEEKK
jgi:ribonuclease-3 family protein